MGIAFEELEAELLKLSKPERARLAEQLISSLDEDSEIDEAWAAEIDRRIAQVENGAIRLIPATEVLAQARAALK
jgi:putative addiction module component (TIGR02574 family)